MDLVQPIVVLKSGNHEDTIAAAAMASYGWHLLPQRSSGELQAEAQWLQGRFTKTVRRASDSQIQALLEWAHQEQTTVEDQTIGDARALAFGPMTYEDFPKPLRKLQVQGTDFSREVGSRREGLTIKVLSTLTTGKASAQAAHALWIWALRKERAAANLVITGMAPNVQLVTAEELEGLAALNPELVVKDAGLTEIEADTHTAILIES